MSASVDFAGVTESEVPTGCADSARSLCRVISLQRGWRAWPQSWIDEGPSWLISLIFHLVAFLVVTSVAVPWTGNRGSGSGEISLTLGFADVTVDSQGPEVTIEPNDSRSDEEPTETEASATGRKSPLNEQPAAATAASRGLKARAAASSGASPSMDPSSTEGRSANAGRIPKPNLEVSPYAALLTPRRPTSGMSGAVARHAEQFALALSNEPLTPHERAMDRIVDDFIAYDIGRLRGAAGTRARQRFAELGVEAIPALVRGLNKAAGIHASCPVGVIAGKLMMTLRSANDPSLRQYAIDHVGVGVSESAPHFQRLAALRNNWLGAPAMPAKVAAMVDRLETRQDGELMELMLALSDAPSDTVIAALRSGDEYLAGAAALAILQGPHRWDAQQRSHLRAALSYFQTTAVNPQVRSLAADAHGVLSR